MELKLDKSKTYAIALEGGGAKGAYEIGAWRALGEAGIRYNAVSGTSVGSLNGAMMAMGDLQKAEDFWKNIRFSQVMKVDDTLMKRVFAGDFKDLDVKSLFRTAVDTVRQGGFDVEPLRALLKEAIDARAVLTSDVNLYLMTYSVTDRKELDVDAKTLNEEELYDMLLASAYFPAFKHEKLGGKMYTDGGVQDAVPIHSLTSRGYKDLIVMRLYGFGLQRRFKMPKDVTITTIAPTRELGQILNFSSDQSRFDMRLGYFDAERVLYGLYGVNYSIDRTLDEEAAYGLLRKMCEKHDPDKTLREINEACIPALAARSGGKKGDYYDLLIAVLESAAGELSIDPFSVVTDAELYQAILRRGGSLSPDQMGPFFRYMPAE